MNDIALVISRYLSARLPFYYGWIVVFAAGTTTFARMAPATTTLALFLSPMADEFGWSRTLIAGSVSLGAVSSIFLSPIVGWAVDRFGARLILSGSMVVLGIAIVSLAWATTPVLFYLGFATGRVIFQIPLKQMSVVGTEPPFALPLHNDCCRRDRVAKLRRPHLLRNIRIHLRPRNQP